jgi:hypothetical protein|tara:strand:+ start:1025 stop:1288 length:264 start_codon:yes stop_codon:yes gene_type:complete
MKIQNTQTTAVDFGNETYTNTYVSNWSGNVELKFQDYADGGDEYKLNITLPLAKARALAKELTTDLQNYDMEQAKQAQEEAEEAVEE